MPTERRAHARRAVELTARLAHEASGRGFRCLCVEVSAGGARLLVPAAVPVRAGHVIRLAGVEGTGTADERIATAVRVERGSLAADGSITVAVRWATPPSPSQ